MKLRYLATLTAALTLACCSAEDSDNVDDAVDGDAETTEVGEFTFGEATPESVGMNAEILEGARDYAFAEGKNTQSVVIVRDGTIVAEWYADDRDRDSFAASWSVAKSVTSSLIGIALDRGEIPSIDEPMTTYVPDWEGTERDDIVLRDVLEMASGLTWVEDYDPSNLTNSDVAEMVLDGEGSQLAIVTDNEVEHPPGTEFNYSSGDTMLLSHVIEVATGKSAGDYADEHLFGPLGIEQARWWEDPSGDTLTYCCLDMTARDFARFGQLFLEGGALSGKRIVPEAWVEDSIEPSPSYDGYSYQWWLTGNEYEDEKVPDDTYSALGHDGQYIHIIPSLDLVVVRHGLYWPHDGEAVAEPSLFVVYPSDGLFPESGTAPPDSWSVPDFLAPIVDSIED
jgi:CubicO group peptidase (beta-lactamase class C family)